MKRYLLIIIAITFVFSGCKKKNSLDVDVSDIKVDLKIERFDVEFFTIQTDKIYYEIPKFEKKYAAFFDIYNYELIGVGLPTHKDYYENLNRFYDYCDSKLLTDEVWRIFPQNDDFIHQKLESAFKHYKYYYPEKEIPRIITAITGFSVSVFTGQDFIGISLDKYLGANFKPYSTMFDKYLYRRMNKNMIPVDVMKSLCIVDFPYHDSINTVLTKMIYEGKIQYFLDAMLPNTADSLKWGYTDIQFRWADKFQSQIWDYLVSENILFSNKIMEIKTFTGEAPFTTPFKSESAPRAGTFIGYRIVQAYMENNENVTLQEFMNENDYMKIYNLSFFEP
ncbi:MAG: hypothetical protein U9Q83_03650 [Bacteroidota bacterium]|nr:hypothetical protein [Bacteroidota bacterium]